MNLKNNELLMSHMVPSVTKKFLHLFQQWDYYVYVTVFNIVKILIFHRKFWCIVLQNQL